MTTTVAYAENYAEFALDGRLVAAATGELNNALSAALAKRSHILFDLSRMTHVDSSGLGLLVKVLQRTRAMGGGVRLACLQQHPRIVFDITRVSCVFQIFDTLEEARKGFGEPQL